jgi:hypothetical protein
MKNQPEKPLLSYRINLILSFLQKRLTTKNILFASLVIIILLLIISSLLSSRKSKPNQTSTSPIPSPTPLKTQSGEYHINGILNMIKPVTGYSWTSDEQLLYSTPDGIYFASSNQPLLKQNIDQISWSATGNAVFSSNKQWYYFEHLSKSTKKLNIIGTNVSLSQNNQRLASFNGSSVTYVDTFNLTPTTVNLESPITNLMWSNNLNWNAVELTTDKNTIIKIYDDSLSLKTTHTLDVGSKLLSLSPEGDKVVVKETNKISVINSSGNKTAIPNDLEFVNAKALFENNNSLIYIITAVDKIGRKISHVYRWSSDQKNEYLVNDMPAPRRFNLEVELHLNQKQTCLALVENNSYIWMVALKAGLLPSYDQNGLTFFSVKPANRNPHLPESY